jgi:hypothetical protein
MLAAGHAFGGTVIFDQSTTLNGNGFDMTDNRIADDFTLASASIVQGINFEYIFSGGGSPGDLSFISIGIYADNSGSPGTLISEQDDLAVTGSADSSNVCPNCSLASIAITNVALGAGNYWLELHAGSSLNDGTNAGSTLEIDWAAVNDNATLGAQYAALGTVPNTPVDVSGYNDYAFQLTEPAVTATPEPGTATAVLLGLLWIVRRKLVKRSSARLA